MKTNVQFAVSILLLLFLVSSCKANQPMKSLKVMSYNIHIATPGSISDFNITDLQAVADVIIREKPDVVVLQEVDKYTVRSNKDSHQAKDLGEMTGMYYHFAGASYKSEGEQGQAILSKYPIKDAKSYKLPLPEESNGETRSLAIIIVEIEGVILNFLHSSPYTVITASFCSLVISFSLVIAFTCFLSLFIRLIYLLDNAFSDRVLKHF